MGPKGVLDKGVQDKGVQDKGVGGGVGAEYFQVVFMCANVTGNIYIECMCMCVCKYRLTEYNQ